MVLAIGVRYSEVSTGCYSIPPHRCLIHVDANPNNIGRIVKPAVAVHADAGVFFDRVLAAADDVGRPPDAALACRIRDWKCQEAKERDKRYARCGADPMLFLLALRQATCPDALAFVDVTCAEHWAAEAYTMLPPAHLLQPDRQPGDGLVDPRSAGAQRVHIGRQVVTVTGDGCFLMTAMEISTAARECLPVKFFVLDDQAYHYHAAVAGEGVPADDGDDPGAAGLRGLGQGIRRRLHGDRLRQGHRRRHPGGAGAARAGADAGRDRLRQAADPLAGRGAQRATSTSCPGNRRCVCWPAWDRGRWTCTQRMTRFYWVRRLALPAMDSAASRRT